MGKASSAKKVARAARAGGKTSKRERPKLAYPLAVFMVVVLGTLLVVYARTSRTDTASADTPPSSLKKDHWHAAYGFYVCDKFLPSLPESPKDPQGIHTHGDGVMHIHPFSGAASGTNARLKVFGNASDIKFADDGWTMPDGTEYKNGYDCNGKPAKTAVYRWSADDPTVPIEVFDTGYGDIRFRSDRDAYTFAVIPEDAPTPPMPDTVAELDRLTDVEPGSQGQTSPSLPPGVSIPDPANPGGIVPPSGAPGQPGVSVPPVSTPAVPPVSDAGVPPSSTPAPAPSTP